MDIAKKELTTLSGVALGGIVGGVLSSPLGPWVVVGGSTVGATVGGWITSRIWREFYSDLREKMEQVKTLLEKEDYSRAIDLIGSIREHPNYEEQERHFRSELEMALSRVTLHLARKTEEEGRLEEALTCYRRARQLRPQEPFILESIIRLKVELTDLSYEEGGQLEADLQDLIALDPRSVRAYRGLFELYDRQGKSTKLIETLKQAVEALQDRVFERLPFLEELHRRLPDDGDVPLELLELYLTEDSPEKAMALLDEETSKGEALAGEARWEAAKGECYYRRGDADRAEQSLQRVLELTGVFPRANLVLGRLFVLQKRWEEAVKVLSPLVSFPRYVRQALAPLHRALIKTGRLREAKLHLERSVFKELPEYSSCLKSLARAFENTGKGDEARRLWNLLGESSAGPPFWQEYAIVYREGNPVLLGSGRMGRVYLGRRREDHSMVAIREVPIFGMHDSLRLKRFRREIELLSKLKHPRLVQLYGHALFEGKCIMAVEYCSGGSLADKMGKELLWAESKELLLAVLEGLEYIHGNENALVHRNLKPSNILLPREGRAKISDLALSRLQEPAATSVITSVQEQAKSYRYLAPEVILGSAELGIQADFYSLGCIAYEMVTGRAPFEAPSSDEVIRAHLKESPKEPSTHAPWVPKELDGWILSLLEKTPSKRPSSARYIAARLEKI